MPLASTLALGSTGLLAGSGTLSDAVFLALVGVAVVFCALALTWAAVTAVTRLLAAPADDTGPPVAAAGDRPPPAGESIDPRIVAVLTAAATVAVGAPIRLRCVRRFHRDPNSAWMAHGRVLVHSSHRFQKRYA